MLEVDFAKMSSVELLCAHLQTTPNTIHSIVHDAAKHYTRIELARRGGRRPRVVFEASPAVRRLHRTIAVALKPILQSMPEYLQGFRKGRGIRTNAAMHVKRADGTRPPVVVTADIRGFFDNINLTHVWWMFRRLGAPERTALLLGRLCTLNDCLPQGGRASPTISNLAVPDLDRALVALAPRATFTRYADDITFSGGEGECPSETALSNTLADFGFSLRDRSYRLQRARSGQIVTGVSLSSGKPSLTRRKRRAIDRLLNIGKRYGMSLHEYARVAGYVRSIGAIDPDLRDDWMKRLGEVTVETTEADDPE